MVCDAGIGIRSLQPIPAMSNPRIIPTNFRVKKRSAEHVWLMFCDDVPCAIIRGIGGSKKLEYSVHPRASETGEQDGAARNLAMDWMAESVEHLRVLCQ